MTLRSGLAALFCTLVATARAQSAPPGDEIILDPELEAVAPAPSTAVQPTSLPNAELRVVLRSRLGMDLQWQDAREDVWEATQIALFEARVRRSERLRFEIGVRARHQFAAREHDSVDADAERYEFDAAPTAAFADVGLSDAVHLRLGYQTVHLGRFDVLNPSDILSVHDLRSGPTTMPEAGDIAQPAARLDWDAGSWLSLSVIALPFFEPQRISAFDGDYALSLSRQSDIDASNTTASIDPSAPGSIERLVRATLSRSGQSRLGNSALSAFTPEASLSHPQAALRVLAHGSDGELGLTAGTALEHLPALEFSQAFLDYTSDPSTENEAALQADTSPIEVRYNRFAVASLDATTAIGPLQVGAELAYILGRTLFAAELAQVPRAQRSDMAHLGLRAEYTQSDAFVFAVEATAARALRSPSDSAKRFMFLTPGRFMLTAIGFVAHSPGDLGFTLELSGGVLNGPSYLIAPRAEQRLATGFYVEAGAYVLGGKAPGPAGDPNLALGGLYGDGDQVFIGLRWLP